MEHNAQKEHSQCSPSTHTHTHSDTRSCMRRHSVGFAELSIAAARVAMDVKRFSLIHVIILSWLWCGAVVIAAVDFPFSLFP